MNIKKRKKLGTLLTWIALLPFMVLMIVGLMMVGANKSKVAFNGLYQALIVFFVFQMVVFIVCFAIGYYYEAIYTPMQEQNALLEEMLKEKKSNNGR